MASQTRISSEDMRVMFTAARELQAAGGSTLQRQSRLLERLRSLTNSDIAVLSLASIARSSSTSKSSESMRGATTSLIPKSFLYSGRPTRPHGAYAQFLSTLKPTNPADAPLLSKLAQRRRLVTMHRAEAVADHEWLASEYVRSVHSPASLHETIYSICEAPKSKFVTLLSIHRCDPQALRFTDRESSIVHLLHSHASPIFRASIIAKPNGIATPSQATDSSLTPRQRVTLEYLLDGASEKEIAARLSRSHHTVHVHVKGIYRAFEVTTRAELLSKLLKRPIDDSH